MKTQINLPRDHRSGISPLLGACGRALGRSGPSEIPGANKSREILNAVRRKSDVTLAPIILCAFEGLLSSYANTGVSMSIRQYWPVFRLALPSCDDVLLRNSISCAICSITFCICFGTIAAGSCLGVNLKPSTR